MDSESFYFDISAEGPAVFLGPTEALLMELAWAHPRLTVKKALVLLDSEPAPAYTTIMTVLNRLASKNLLVREREGKHFVYRAASTRDHFLRERVSAVVGTLKKNFPELLRGAKP